MRSFKYVGGVSDKYWKISTPLKIDDNQYAIVRKWGRTGSKGQTQSRVFAYHSSAITFRDSKIAEKLREGYVENTRASVLGTTCPHCGWTITTLGHSCPETMMMLGCRGCGKGLTPESEVVFRANANGYLHIDCAKVFDSKATRQSICSHVSLRKVRGSTWKCDSCNHEIDFAGPSPSAPVVPEVTVRRFMDLTAFQTKEE